MYLHAFTFLSCVRAMYSKESIHTRVDVIVLVNVLPVVVDGCTSIWDDLPGKVRVVL